MAFFFERFFSFERELVEGVGGKEGEAWGKEKEGQKRQG
jgi:hypothetical protein